MAAGSKQDPWVLTTPPGTSGYTMYKDEQASPPALVCQVGSTTLKYHLQAIDDLHAWLAGQGDWVPLGAADEKKPAAQGTVEAWGRSPDNPVGGWYGLRNGYRGPVRDVSSPAAGGTRPRRGHPRPPQQPDARDLSRTKPGAPRARFRPARPSWAQLSPGSPPGAGSQVPTSRSSAATMSARSS